MTTDGEDLPTLLPDLTQHPTGHLPNHPDTVAALREAVRQAERPRRNLGGSGPPGRED